MYVDGTAVGTSLGVAMDTSSNAGSTGVVSMVTEEKQEP